MSRKEGGQATESLEGNTGGTLGPMDVSTKQRRIAELAKRSPEMCFTALNHHLDMELLQEAYRIFEQAGC